MKKNILNILGSVLILGTGFIGGYVVSKKRYSPKKTFGEIYIDYTENPNNPIMYLNNLDTKTFLNSTKYIIIGVNHIRK